MDNERFTSMWKVFPGKYLYQTYDKRVAEKMKRSNNFYFWSKGINCKFWIFICKKKNKRDALNTLVRLTGSKPIFNPLSEVFEA